MTTNLMQLINKLDHRSNHIGRCPSLMTEELWNSDEVFPQCIIYCTAETGSSYVYLTDEGAEVEDVEQYIVNFSEVLIRIDNSADCAGLSDPEWTKCFEWCFKFADITGRETVLLLDRAVKEVGSIQLLIMALRSACNGADPTKK